MENRNKWERASTLEGESKDSGCPSSPEGLSHRKALYGR